MLPLESPRWNELRDAYGLAKNIPALLRAAADKPKSSNYKDEPWFSLWSALAHQNSVYAASYAAVPHLVAIAESKDPSQRLDCITLAGFIEKDREGTDAAAVPDDLRDDYFASVARNAVLAHGQMMHATNASDLQALFTVFAACRGFHVLAEKLEQVDLEVGEE